MHDEICWDCANRSKVYLMRKRWLSKYGVRNMILQHDALTNEEITIVNMLTVCELIVVSALKEKKVLVVIIEVIIHIEIA